MEKNCENWTPKKFFNTYGQLTPKVSLKHSFIQYNGELGCVRGKEEEIHPIQLIFWIWFP